jgi:hypothetical protein
MTTADTQQPVERGAGLAADASSYITGQIWAVNGGLDM